MHDVHEEHEGDEEQNIFEDFLLLFAQKLLSVIHLGQHRP